MPLSVPHEIHELLFSFKKAHYNVTEYLVQLGGGNICYIV